MRSEVKAVSALALFVLSTALVCLPCQVEIVGVPPTFMIHVTNFDNKTPAVGVPIIVVSDPQGTLAEKRTDSQGNVQFTIAEGLTVRVLPKYSNEWGLPLRTSLTAKMTPQIQEFLKLQWPAESEAIHVRELKIGFDERFVEASTGSHVGPTRATLIDPLANKELEAVSFDIAKGIEFRNAPQRKLLIVQFAGGPPSGGYMAVSVDPQAALERLSLELGTPMCSGFFYARHCIRDRLPRFKVAKLAGNITNARWAGLTIDVIRDDKLGIYERLYSRDIAATLTTGSDRSFKAELPPGLYSLRFDGSQGERIIIPVEVTGKAADLKTLRITFGPECMDPKVELVSDLHGAS